VPWIVPLCLRAQHFHRRIASPGLPFRAHSLSSRPRFTAGGFGSCTKFATLPCADRACSFSAIFLAMSLVGAGVKKPSSHAGFGRGAQSCLSLHARALLSRQQSAPGEGYYRKSTLVLAGTAGCSPPRWDRRGFHSSHQIESIRLLKSRCHRGLCFLSVWPVFLLYLRRRKGRAQAGVCGL